MNKLIGYNFEGKFYDSLEELKGRTMNEGNKSEPIYAEDESEI